MGRSLVSASVRQDDAGDVVMEFLCDCTAATTVKAVDPADAAEFAFTCAGCQTPHWLTLEKVFVDPESSTEDGKAADR